MAKNAKNAKNENTVEDLKAPLLAAVGAADLPWRPSTRS